MTRLALLLLLFLIGCQTAPEELPEVQSSWGRVYNITQTPQVDAPVFALNEMLTAFAWVGSDERGVHHDVRILNSGGLSAITALPLSPVRPSAFQLVPTADNNTLLLYLDANSEGETRLFSAVFDPTLTLRAGPTLISTLRTDPHYTVTASDDNTFWVVWSGGAIAEPTLYAQLLDPLGRPRPVQTLTYNSTHPVLRQNADRSVSLYWLGETDVYQARFENGTLRASAPIASMPRMEAGERLIDFNVGQDSTSVYLFWNMMLPQGTPRTWFTRDDGGAPIVLGLGEASGNEFLTGYNGGTGIIATEGETPVLWASPAAEQSDPLPVAAQIGNQLGVIYFQEGQIVGYQPVYTLQHDLLGLPMVKTDIERHLYLTWAEPISSTSALLRYTATR